MSDITIIIDLTTAVPDFRLSQRATTIAKNILTL
jgi:hypothetical protein